MLEAQAAACRKRNRICCIDEPWDGIISCQVLFSSSINVKLLPVSKVVV